jgi:hypothetical protein
LLRRRPSSVRHTASRLRHRNADRPQALDPLQQSSLIFNAKTQGRRVFLLKTELPCVSAPLR